MKYTKQDWFLMVLLCVAFVVAIFFGVPLVQPEFTIQCVSEPCIVPNITLWERYFVQI